MRFDVGDVVIIRNDITAGLCYVEALDENGYVNNDMVEFAGQITTITKVEYDINHHSCCGYRIAADDEDWYWYDHLLEPANNLSVEGFDNFIDMFL